MSGTLLLLLASRIARRHRIKERRRRMKDLRLSISFDDIPEEDFLSHFRVSKEVFREIYAKISPIMDEGRIRQRRSNAEISNEKQLLAVLHVLGSGSYQVTSGAHSLLGMSQKSVSRAMRRVVPLIEEEWGDEIKFPQTAEERAMVANGFSNIGPFRECLGALDSTHIKVLRPAEKDEQYVHHRGEFHSLNVQVVCDSNLRFLDIVVKPGHVQDAFIWDGCSVRMEMLRLYEREGAFFLLGDSRYELETVLLTPISRPRSLAEKKYSDVHKSSHNVGQKCFQALRSRFRILHSSRCVTYDPTFAISIVNTCAILHNLCLKLHVPLPPATEAEEVHTKEVPPPALANHPTAEAITRRDRIVTEFSSTR